MPIEVIPVPDFADVRVDLKVAVQSRKVKDETFHPTDVQIHPFHAITNLEEYLTVTPGFSETIYEFLVEQRTNLWENYLQIEVRLDNVQAVPMGAGAYPLPKGHRSAGLTGSEVTSDEIIERSLNQIVADLKQAARY